MALQALIEHGAVTNQTLAVTAVNCVLAAYARDPAVEPETPNPEP